MYSKKYEMIKLLQEATGQGLSLATDVFTLRTSQLEFKHIQEQCPHVMSYYDYFTANMTQQDGYGLSNTDIVAMFFSVMGVYTSVMPDSLKDTWFVTIHISDFYAPFNVKGLLGEYQFQDIGSYDSMLVLSQLNGFYILEKVLESAQYNFVNDMSNLLRTKLNTFHRKDASLGYDFVPVDEANVPVENRVKTGKVSQLKGDGVKTCILCGEALPEVWIAPTCSGFCKDMIENSIFLKFDVTGIHDKEKIVQKIGRIKDMVIDQMNADVKDSLKDKAYIKAGLKVAANERADAVDFSDDKNIGAKGRVKIREWCKDDFIAGAEYILDRVDILMQ